MSVCGCVQAYKTFGNRVMAVWKKFEEQRAAIQAAIESPVDEAALSSASSIDQEAEDNDKHMIDEDVGADDSNDPLPYIGPPFIDEPLNDEDICKYSLICFCVRILFSSRPVKQDVTLTGRNMTGPLRAALW